ncbi:hypothetical protein EB796_006652 [Bugula neritina]|uniref:Sushi domain-containing protein n=1 Tax=Bugula neritina TaxID=10212 RepID=A0A7J7KBP9_BUGNE|nr:hypothetical protein EB796_006652 [Bugula neritina]
MTTSCDEQGHWTLQNPPYCTVKDCGRLEDGTNTQPVPSNIPTIYNSSYTYQCNIGFESSAKLTAFSISCGPPPEGIKTESFVDGYNQEYLDYYKYRCKPGYTTDDEVIAQCLASKRWSILPPTCHAKKCETPPNGENTKAVPNSIATTYGSSYTYECEDGYEAPSAEMETVCNHQGQWTLKPLPVCTGRLSQYPLEETKQDTLIYKLITSILQFLFTS